MSNGEGPAENQGGDPAGGVLKGSINKAAYAYTDKHVGPKEDVGNKAGSLSNRLRAVLA